jgi:hypothetical protein
VEEHDDTRTIRAKVTGQVLTLDETLQDTIPALLSLLDALPGDSPFLQLVLWCKMSSAHCTCMRKRANTSWAPMWI